MKSCKLSVEPVPHIWADWPTPIPNPKDFKVSLAAIAIKKLTYFVHMSHNPMNSNPNVYLYGLPIPNGRRE